MSQMELVLGRFLRKLPEFRGKGRIGAWLRERVVQKLGEEEAIQTVRMRDGSRMKLDIRSNTEGMSFYTGKYDSLLPSILARLNPCDDIFDVGANIGLYTIPLGRFVSSHGGRVFAFEPVAANFDRLSENIRLNSLEGVVHLYQVALGDAHREVFMHVDNDHGAQTGNAFVEPSRAFQDRNLQWPAVRTTMVRLDDYLDRLPLSGHRCGFIKVDIEGNEPLFLRGAIKFIQQHSPIVLAEMNSVWLQRNGLDCGDYTSILSWDTYTAYRWNSNTWDEFRSHDGLRGSEGEQFLFVPRS